jgi:predicted nucleic acid-binding protein
MNLAIDASVFVAASRADEAHYHASRQFLQQINVVTTMTPLEWMAEQAVAK